MVAVSPGVVLVRGSTATRLEEITIYGRRDLEIRADSSNFSLLHRVEQRTARKNLGPRQVARADLNFGRST